MKTNSVYSDKQLRKALFNFHDLMERLTCPFMPLKKLAKQIREDSKLEGDKLTVGIKYSEWTPPRESMFNTLMIKRRTDVIETTKGYEFEMDGVKVDMHIIKRKYKFFKNPQIRFFGVVEFLLPNPLDVYLKSQYLIK